MSLLLHWLRWDLRRFRWLLLAWTVLLAGFVCYLGWLHLNLLTIDPRILKYNEAAGAVLGIVEFFLLLRILSTDPAAGVRPFWKTRPPTGFAVAGAKAAIVIIFFLALPMLLQWIMYQWCDLGEPGPRWSGKTWPWMLWWTQCLAVGALLLAAAAAGGAGEVLGRLAGGIFAFVAASMIAISWDRAIPRPPYYRGAYTSTFESGVLHAGNISLWLAAALAAFLLSRRTRAPARLIASAPFVIPPLALLSAALLASPSLRYQAPALPALEHQASLDLRIGEPAFGDGVNVNFWDADQSKFVAIQLRLRLEGLPPDRLAHAEWTDLKLMFDDGREIPIPAERLQQGRFREPGHTRLTVAPFVLPADDLAPYSLQPCRAAGTLRVTLEQKRTGNLEKQPGAELAGSGCLVRLQHLNDLDSPTIPHGLFDLSASSREATELLQASFFLLDPAEEECRLYLSGNGVSDSRGYFMERFRRDWSLHEDNIRQPVARARAQRAAAAGRLSQWRLMASWYERVGTTDIPVTLHHVFIPRMPSDSRRAEDILPDFRVTPEMSAMEAERIIRFALKLPSLTAVIPNNQVVISRPGPNHPFLGAFAAFLSNIPASRLPALLSIAEHDRPSDGSMEPPWGPVFRKHIADQLDADAARALEQSHPKAFHYLASEMAARGWIPQERARQTSTQRLSDADLFSEWKSPQGKYAAAYFLRPEPLVEALRRGLPWAPGELAELANLVPGEITPSDLMPAVSKFSDCPADPAAAIPWLQQNAARLTWDAGAKRWVLPSTP